MPVEQGTLGIISSVNVVFWIKPFFLLFIVFYCFFSFMLIKQIQHVTRELPTPIMPFLRFIGILNLGVSISLLFLVIGLF